MQALLLRVPAPSINLARIMDLGTCPFGEERVWVLIAGPTGTGKSHIAQTIGREAIHRGYDVSFTTRSGVLGQLQAPGPPKGLGAVGPGLAPVGSPQGPAGKNKLARKEVKCSRF